MFAIHRNLEKRIETDLEKKFVFLSGPRQVGKTTLAKRIIQAKKGRYLLYDDETDREIILTKKYINLPWVCLDEFHKFPRWKNHLKGVYDKYHETLHLILTGSARLDIYQKFGDSLVGRYYPYHLHPLTVRELNSQDILPPPNNFLEVPGEAKGITELLKFGGFPEPFHLQSEQEHRRWSNTRRQLLIKEDIQDLTKINLLGLMEQLMLLLPERIGSMFSYRSLAEILQVSPPTVQNWMDILSRLFIVFSIRPYTKQISRTIQKQPKFYCYDWSQIPDEGARFENFVASHLWKAAQIWTDLGEANVGLHYIRDRDHREVDFLLTKEQKPWLLIEVKLSETKISETLGYFSQHLNVPAIQLLLKGDIVKETGNILVVSANRWLSHLP